jgi:pimeloyl-ACP methyl ester carboxylesterase
LPYVENKSVRVHFEVAGEGPALVLQHGLTDDLRSWQRLGYVEALQSDFRLVLIDARGHGESDKPHDPASYSFSAMAGDVVAVADELGLAMFHYYGYSMGGGIGFRLARDAGPRLLSCIIGGAVDRVPAPVLQLDGIFAQGMEAFVRMSEGGGPLAPEARSALLAQDAEALRACVLGMAADDLSGDASAVTMPCLAYAGEKDPDYQAIKDMAAKLPDARFVGLPGLGHAGAWNRSGLILPHVSAFLSGVTGVPARPENSPG